MEPNSKLNLVHTDEVFRSVREHPPAHYTMKIESFNSVKATLGSIAGQDRIESTEFNVGGRTWILCIYPTGNKGDGGHGHLSIYLKLEDELEDGDDVMATFRFFIYDQKRDNYLVIQDLKDKRFYSWKAEWGISKALELCIFNDASNGFLVNDRCVFGAEVLVFNEEKKLGDLSMVQKKSNRLYKWKIEQFCKQNDKFLSSNFTLDGHSWSLCLRPHGTSFGTGNFISVFLHLNDAPQFGGGKKILAEYELCIKDQVGQKDLKRPGTSWFSSSETSWGFRSMLALDEVKNSSNGYLKNDTLMIEVHIKNMFVLQAGTDALKRLGGSVPPIG
ncbi:hypothetical protein Droror1_Dr00026144 [Drosera rotundifolia]